MRNANAIFGAAPCYKQKSKGPPAGPSVPSSGDRIKRRGPPMNVPISFRMRLGMLALVVATFAVLLGQARAQEYPTRVVHVIAPFGPGGPADVFSRVVAQKLSDTFKQGFLVENRPGASTMIGTDAVAKAAPDGHTLVIISQTHAANKSPLAPNPLQLTPHFPPAHP